MTEEVRELEVGDFSAIQGVTGHAWLRIVSFHRNVLVGNARELISVKKYQGEFVEVAGGHP